MIIILPIAIIAGILLWVLRPGKSPASQRKIAILATVVPSVAIAVAAIVFQLLHNATGVREVSGVSNTLFVVSLCLIGAYILALIGFALSRRGEIAKGAGFGTCVAVILSIVELGLLEWLGGV